MNEILEKRRIGSTDVFVTELGMGGAPLGRVSPENASESLRESFNQGIRYFDTAPLYGTGTSEKFFGKFLSKLDRQSFVLSTKVGRLIKDTGNEVNITFNYKRDEILRSIEESLKRLDMDSIDIALIHDPDDHYDLALNEAFPTLDKLRSEIQVMEKQRCWQTIQNNRLYAKLKNLLFNSRFHGFLNFSKKSMMSRIVTYHVPDQITKGFCIMPLCKILW